MQSNTATVEEYLAGLEASRADTIAAVLDVVRGAMPPGYAEEMQLPTIGWGVPLSRFPVTYNNLPLSYVALASKKRHCSLHLMGLYMNPWQEDFRERWSAPRPLDMGKACIHFRTAADLDLPLIAETIASVPVVRLIEMYEGARGRTSSGARPLA